MSDPRVKLDGMVEAFLSYWRQYTPLDNRHRQWLHQHGMALSHIPQGWTLHSEGARNHYLFFVIEGLLGGVSWDTEAHRRIHLLAPPGHNLMSTRNFYTDKQVPYEIIAMRTSAVLRLPVSLLRQLKEQDGAASELVAVLREKQLKQHLIHNAILQIHREGDRYRTFERYFHGWTTLLTLQEMADYLAISVASVKRARRGDI